MCVPCKVGLSIGWLDEQAAKPDNPIPADWRDRIDWTQFNVALASSCVMGWIFRRNPQGWAGWTWAVRCLPDDMTQVLHSSEYAFTAIDSDAVTAEWRRQLGAPALVE